MMKRLRLYLMTLLSGGVLLAAASAPSAMAIELFPTCNGPSANTAVCKATKTDSVDKLVVDITGILMWILGIVAVIMIVIGGFKYVTSNGDANAIQSAKNTILYSVIGLVVAILGQTIVKFVVGLF